ncbi:hypothetical protein MNBD_NITROSPINAE04-224 [hydrothermal vent metagenome]|uniref:Uncharacterized protein n=1 Tax=hydrothermal vent metagenome TaxID=652676 RepID=A0A3B1BS23_9ZZZZ
MNDIPIGALAFIPLALFAIYFIKSRSATAQVWISFARRRGLEYNDLRGAGKNRGLDTSMKARQSSTVMRLLSVGAMPRITGENNEFPFELSTIKKGSGNNKTLYSFMKLELKDLPAKINVLPERSIHKVIKIFGYQDIQTGDADFDEKFIVRGENPEQALSYLTPERRDTLKKYSMEIPGLELRQGAIYMERRGLIKKMDELEKLFRELGKLAIALG